jgi:hypothetical protein
MAHLKTRHSVNLFQAAGGGGSVHAMSHDAGVSHATASPLPHMPVTHTDRLNAHTAHTNGGSGLVNLCTAAQASTTGGQPQLRWPAASQAPPSTSHTSTAAAAAAAAAAVHATHQSQVTGNTALRAPAARQLAQQGLAHCCSRHLNPNSPGCPSTLVRSRDSPDKPLPIHPHTMCC